MPPAERFQDKHAEAIAAVAEAAGVKAGDVFLYSSYLTPNQERHVFQAWVGSVPGAREVCLSSEEAGENLQVLLAWCRDHPDEAKALTEHYRA